MIAVLSGTGCSPASRPNHEAQAVPEGFVAFAHPSAGYRTIYPQGWTPRAGTDARFQNFVSPDQQSFLLVDLLPRRFSDADLEEAGSLFQFDALGGALPVRSPQQRRTRVNGVAAVEVTAAYRTGPEELTLRYYVFSLAERSWVVAYLGPTPKFAGENPLFERFARGLRVVDRAKPAARVPQIGEPPVPSARGFRVLEG